MSSPGKGKTEKGAERDFNGVIGSNTGPNVIGKAQQGDDEELIVSWERFRG
ncbi:hypothetical protein SBF1_380006 [Candidatus Desulfosporosinus infrequens]|uniref:Uncharacterized protein n=1 Tax=Candidatus Desulfosporosinus infrequens TaxID=2043169 RepID=A0A2U3L5F5_9FIRM|nr:hypothetical protein SBF1_380006 [Candidatus Desulfosporosinus infrequens]